MLLLKKTTYVHTYEYIYIYIFIWRISRRLEVTNCKGASGDSLKHSIGRDARKAPVARSSLHPDDGNGWDHKILRNVCKRCFFLMNKLLLVIGKQQKINKKNICENCIHHIRFLTSVHEDFDLNNLLIKVVKVTPFYKSPWTIYV